MMASSPICLLSKASKTKSWLWHRRLSHLNFGAINDLARQGLVRESVNGKKYILVIVDDYSRFTWVKFLRSKDETPMFIIKFLKMIQVRLNVPVRPRTMLIYAQAPLFLWAEAVTTTYFTQNRSIIRLRHGKTPYELMHSKQPNLSYFHVFGSLCYPTNDGENVRLALQEMILGTISSGLVQKPSSSTSYLPPSRNDWDLLFQSLFDELLNPPPSVDNQDAEVIAPIAEVQDVGNDNLDIEVAHMGNNSLLSVPLTEVASGQSSSTASPQSIVQPNHPMTYPNSKWTKDHPLNYIIGGVDSSMLD
nr:hypothetical protein [Tanacetum cinerariifolium]